MKPCRLSSVTITVVAMTLAFAGLLTTAGHSAAQPKPDQPAHGWIPTPSFTAPAKYQKFTLTPSLTVDLKAYIPNVQTGYAVPGPFDFVAYAKASPFTEKWNIEIVKEGDHIGSMVSLETFEGPITGYSFSLSLNADWFKKHGPGKYGAKAYLFQEGPQGKDWGLATGVGFEIIQKPGTVVAKSEASLSALAAAMKPNIATLDAKVEITKNCKGPAPALIAAVKLKNTGGSALAAKQALIRLRNIGGVNLEGTADVPAIGIGETIALNVPATSLQPFSSLVGSHQMELPLKPLVFDKGGQPIFKVGPVYTFTVVFPAGYCGGKSLAPPKPKSSAPNEQINPTELNPQPEVPSKPKEKKKRSEREEKKQPAGQ